MSQRNHSKPFTKLCNIFALFSAKVFVYFTFTDKAIKVENQPNQEVSLYHLAFTSTKVTKTTILPEYINIWRKIIIYGYKQKTQRNYQIKAIYFRVGSIQDMALVLNQNKNKTT